MIDREKYFEMASRDPTGALNKLFDDFQTLAGTAIKNSKYDPDHYRDFAEACSVACVLWEYAFKTKASPELGKGLSDPDLMGSIRQFMANLRAEVRKLELTKLTEDAAASFEMTLGKEFAVSLNENDKSKIQQHIDELRKLLSATEEFSESHRRRIVKRLERMQSELHKKFSDMDVFYGGFVDAGVALGKFGEVSKPFFDRMKDIRDIVWSAQRKAEGLENNSEPPQLPSPGSGEDQH